VRRRPAPTGATTSQAPDPTDAIVLDAALSRLPRRLREAIVLRYVLDLDEANAAEVLGISRQTLHTHVKRGLARLRTPELRAELGA
jgi:RNA polymerase sigma factor (sigma-70 family)